MMNLHIRVKGISEGRGSASGPERHVYAAAS